MQSITPSDLSKIIHQGKAVYLLDVRTPAEFAECHVRGAKLMPLDALDPRKALEVLQPSEGETVHLLCKSGARAARAAAQFRDLGILNVCVVEGGTDACVAAGLPVERGGRASIPLDGQVRIAMGVCILVFWLLARFVHPGFTWLIIGMAGGLIFSGISGFCGLTILLGKAPWNQNREAEAVPDSLMRTCERMIFHTWREEQGGSL